MGLSIDGLPVPLATTNDSAWLETFTGFNLAAVNIFKSQCRYNVVQNRDLSNQVDENRQASTL